ARTADDALLARLKELPHLTHLRLDGLGTEAEVTARGRAALAALPLQGLGLYHPKGFDREFAELIGGMPGLGNVFIWTDAPPDDLAAALARPPKLYTLAMNHTLTDGGLDRLRVAKH